MEPGERRMKSVSSRAGLRPLGNCPAMSLSNGPCRRDSILPRERRIEILQVDKGPRTFGSKLPGEKGVTRKPTPNLTSSTAQDKGRRETDILG
jgi:hypothetical protein